MNYSRDDGLMKEMYMQYEVRWCSWCSVAYNRDAARGG